MGDVNESNTSQTGVPRCLKCNKLYKKSETNEHGLCPKCLTEKNGVAEKIPMQEDIKVKPGQVIRQAFSKIIADGKITEDVVSMLTDQEATAKELGIRYPFLKEFSADIPIKELTYVKSHARYSSKPVEVNGKQYLVTNDLYLKNVPKFLEWTKKFY